MGEGLLFKKVDLHTHTPESKCFKNKNITPQEFVNAAINKKLSAIAITDHNTGKWIDKAKEAAISKPLTIFPGVEITVSPGIHIIAILDENKGTEDIQNLLGALKIPAEEQGQSDAICKLGAAEVIDIIKEKDGLAILAHIDGIKGAYTTFTGNPQRRLFNESRYDAVETSSGDLPADYTKENGFFRIPACYQASDNPDPEEPIKHSIEGLGSSCSYFKLGNKITIEGLRQCFIDSKVRIKKMEYAQEALYPKILSLKASEGFLKFQNIKFHRGLNSIIGGKGVGKSLIVELLRFAFDQNSSNKDILKDHESKLEKRLGVQNSVEVVFQKESGTTYMIKRTLEGEYACKNLITDEVYNGNIKELFPILAYSQMEVIKTAEDEGAQLLLIDGFTDLHDENRIISMLQQNLNDNDKQLGDSNKSYFTLESLERDLNTLQEQINEIDKTMGGNEADNNTLNEYKVCEAKNTFLNSQLKYIESLKNIVVETYTKIENAHSIEINAEDKSDGLICGIEEKIVNCQSKLLEELKNSENEIMVTYNLVDSQILEWQLIFKSKEEEYNKLVKESNEKKILASSRKTLIDSKKLTSSYLLAPRRN
ncbi:MAG TPA: PHP domain-containing protein [Clostridium sp.]|uniref:PHP domain-containing protein n=1 Tax=Clostridium sp. TaxID=1506 RepID=UPI002F91D095